jgi:hypothetical protein
MTEFSEWLRTAKAGDSFICAHADALDGKTRPETQALAALAREAYAQGEVELLQRRTKKRPPRLFSHQETAKAGTNGAWRLVGAKAHQTRLFALSERHAQITRCRRRRGGYGFSPQVRRLESHASISSWVQARVLEASLMPGGKPSRSIRFLRVGQQRTMPLAFKSLNRNNCFIISDA